MDQIIVVSCSEDGDIGMRVMSEADFLKRLNEGDFGNPPKLLNWSNPSHGYENLQEREGSYVIRGQFVEPKPVQVVTQYKL